MPFYLCFNSTVQTYPLASNKSEKTYFILHMKNIYTNTFFKITAIFHNITCSIFSHQVRYFRQLSLKMQLISIPMITVYMYFCSCSIHCDIHCHLI